MNNIIKSIKKKDINNCIVQVICFGSPNKTAFIAPFVKLPHSRSSGTGFFIRKPKYSVLKSLEGYPTVSQSDYENENAVYVLTCAHVVDGAETIKIKMIPFGSDLHDCQLVSMIPCNLQEFNENFNTYYDIALLRIQDPDNKFKNKVEYLDIRPSRTLVQGETLVSYGFPLGVPQLMAVSGDFSGMSHLIQHTVPINPGNSGGAIMDKNLNVVAMGNSGIRPDMANNVSYAIPIELFQNSQQFMFSVPPGLKDERSVLRIPIMGFNFQKITDDHRNYITSDSSCESFDKKGVRFCNVMYNMMRCKIIGIDEQTQTASLEADDKNFQFNGRLVNVPFKRIRELKSQEQIQRCVAGNHVHYLFRGYTPDQSDMYVEGTKEPYFIEEGDLLLQLSNDKEMLDVDLNGEVKVNWNSQRLEVMRVMQQWKPTDYHKIRIYCEKKKQCMNLNIRPFIRQSECNLLMFPPYDQLMYVVFGGLCMMRMCANHKMYPQTVKSWIGLGNLNRQKPKIIVVHVFKESTLGIHNIIEPGDMIHKINGINIETIKDIYDSLCQPVILNNEFYITIKTTNGKKYVRTVKNFLAEPPVNPDNDRPEAVIRYILYLYTMPDLSVEDRKQLLTQMNIQ